MDDLGRLKQRLKNEFGIGMPSKGVDEESVRAMARGLFPKVAGKIREKEGKVSKLIRDVTMDRTSKLYGKTGPIDGERVYEIRLSLGLMLFNHKMIKLMLSRMTVVGDGGVVKDETRMSNEKMISAAKSMMSAFWKIGGSSDELMRAGGISLLDMTRSQIEMAAFLLFYSESFIVAHEMGHVIKEQYPECVSKERLMVEAASETIMSGYYDRMPEGKSGDEKIVEFWKGEMLADHIGLDLCLDLGENEMVKMTIFAAAQLALIMYDMLERYYTKKEKRYWRYDTHPPSALRLDYLQTLKAYTAVDPLARTFRELSDFILSEV